MNFMYYKNFSEEKPQQHVGGYKKKEVKRSKHSVSHQHGVAGRTAGHSPNCECDDCCNEYPVRTHLLLDMSYSRHDSEGAAMRKSSTSTKSKFSIFRWFTKKSLPPPVVKEEKLTTIRVNKEETENKEKKVPLTPSDPVTISSLKQDCFMIPAERIRNFYPAGHPIPTPSDHGRVKMLLTSDPNFHLAFHLIGPAVPVTPSLQSPLLDLHGHQKENIVKAFKAAVAGLGQGASNLQGMVLLNLERGGELGAVEFPFIIVWIADGRHCDLTSTFSKLRKISLENLDPSKTGFYCTHSFHSYNEVATLARPPLEKLARKANTPNTGYILSVFRVFEGDDCQKFESNWLGWSGARTLYNSMTPQVGLRRLTLHKSNPQNGHLFYILMCDCANFLTDIPAAVKAVPSLRMRLCGDTGLYRPICTL